MIRNLLIIGIIAAIGYFVWTYIESSYKQMDAAKQEIHNTAAENQKRIEEETDRALAPR